MARRAKGSTNITAGHRWSHLRPRPLLPIDKAVEMLTRQTHRRHIPPDFEGDPYQVARHWLALAIVAASDAAAREAAIRERAEALKSELRRAEALRKEMADFADAFSPGRAARPPQRGFARPDYEAGNQAFDRMAEAREALLADPMRAIVEGLRQALADAPALRRDVDAFSISFAEMMGYGWKSLTGRDPDTGEPFKDFVANARNTLSGKRNGPISQTIHVAPWKVPKGAAPINWQWAIRKALARVAERPEWDRWDRYERQLHPPGTTFDDRTEQERRAWRNQRWAEAERDNEEFLKAMAAAPESEKDQALKQLEAMAKRSAARIEASRRKKPQEPS